MFCGRALMKFLPNIVRRLFTSPALTPETPSFSTLLSLLLRLSLFRYKLTEKTERSTEVVTRAEILFCFQPPALRIFLLGVRGSGKSTVGRWLAQKLGLFHIEFREQLQMLIIAKTKKRIPYADEVMLLEQESKDLEVLIKDTMEGDQQEKADNADRVNDTEVSSIFLCLHLVSSTNFHFIVYEDFTYYIVLIYFMTLPQDVSMTEKEMAIKAYLSSGVQLNPEILDMVLAPYWKQEPYLFVQNSF